MMNFNFMPLITIEIILTILIAIALRYCDKKVIELQEKLEEQGREIIEGIRNINKELIKINLILEKINKIRKINWFKLIIKVLDIINIMLILAPLGKKNSFLKRLFSIKSIKSLLSLGS